MSELGQSAVPVTVIEAGLACCGVEAGSVDFVTNPLINPSLEMPWIKVEASGDTHILVIAGTVTHALAPSVKAAFDALAEPRVVIAFGACAITGGPYWDSYSVVPGADHVVPVDIHVPGCPPSPQELGTAIYAAAQRVEAAR